MPSIPSVPFVISMDKLASLNEEKDGLLEAIVCLQSYCDEVYKNDIIPKGLRMCVDKLGDKLKLVEEEMKFITSSSP